MHNKIPHRVNLIANFIANDTILLQPVLLSPFFSLANFAELFSFQLLTFVAGLLTGEVPWIDTASSR